MDRVARSPSLPPKPLLPRRSKGRSVIYWICYCLLFRMSGRGKVKKPSTGKRSTKSAKAGLVMPVSRIHRYLKRGRYSPKTSVGASVYLAAVIEYLVAEVNELAGNAAKANKRKTITPRHIMLGVRNDAELNELCKHVHISYGGVLPCIHPSLIKKKAGDVPKAK